MFQGYANRPISSSVSPTATTLRHHHQINLTTYIEKQRYTYIRHTHRLRWSPPISSSVFRIATTPSISPWTAPSSSHWFVLQWCYICVTVVLQQCHSGSIVMLNWFHSGVIMTLRWCYGVSPPATTQSISPWTAPSSSHWFVLQWHYICVTVVLQQCVTEVYYSGVAVVLQCCHSSVTVVLHWQRELHWCHGCVRVESKYGCNVFPAIDIATSSLFIYSLLLPLSSSPQRGIGGPDVNERHRTKTILNPYWPHTHTILTPYEHHTMIKPNWQVGIGGPDVSESHQKFITVTL
jgi:hypothetical protein